MKAYPLGNLDLPVTFSSRTNYRIENLTFEVVDWKGVCHAILGCLAYAKFMAVPNYTYLKLKQPGPNGVITVSGSFEQAYASSREHFNLATTPRIRWSSASFALPLPSAVLTLASPARC